MSTPDSATGAAVDEPEPPARAAPTSLGTQAARQLATTTKTEPQMQAISSRWLLRMLPWVDVKGGTYRVNRRLQLKVGRGRVEYEQNGADDIRVIPRTLTELPALRGYSDLEVLKEIATRFHVREVRAGQVLVEAGQPVAEAFLVVHGRFTRFTGGKYGEEEIVGVVTDGAQLGDEAIGQPDPGLPDIDGCTVARRMRARPGGGRPRLIAVSDFSRGTDRALSRAAGFDAHLTKPLPLTDLLELLDRPGEGTD